MRDGKFADGSKTLREDAWLNMNLRDPATAVSCVHTITVIAISGASIRCMTLNPIHDALEGITHSMCSIDQNHRPYEWVVDNRSAIPSSGVCPPERNAHCYVQALPAPAGI
ncbi:MAG: hypothetical protein ACLT4C_09660 [Butyricicoccus sp.]